MERIVDVSGLMAYCLYKNHINLKDGHEYTTRRWVNGYYFNLMDHLNRGYYFDKPSIKKELIESLKKQKQDFYYVPEGVKLS